MGANCKEGVVDLVQAIGLLVVRVRQALQQVEGLGLSPLREQQVETIVEEGGRARKEEFLVPRGR
jgi:hypothetical protein